MTEQEAPSGVTIVVVLYGTTLTTSPALNSLGASLGERGGRFHVHVHNNSPTIETEDWRPDLELATYTKHPDNPGLARHYNSALAAAERRGDTWLVLLDQDTKVSAEYLDEVLALVDSPPNSSVGAAVPRLLADDKVLSPHKPLRVRTRPLGDPGHYLPSARYSFFNSGCVIRVSAARAVGGFADDWPLEFLDHVMSSRLRAAGYSLQVLSSELQHNLAVLDMPSVSPDRLRNILASEERFFSQISSSDELWWLLLRRILRASLVLLRVRESPARMLEVQAPVRALDLLLRPSATGRARFCRG
jgi:GT2 family glycosyltransferase